MMQQALEVLPVQGRTSSTEAFARDVEKGLTANPKSIPSRYFYDERGSRLFQEITELEEYYPTRSEAEILDRCKGALGDLLAGGPFRLVELGAGDGRKTEVLLTEFVRRGLDCRYVPIDICEEILVDLTGSLEEKLDGAVAVHAIVAEYFDGLELLSRQSDERNLVLFLGSNIGNFDLFHARVFLDDLRHSLGAGDYVLVGFDLKKDIDVLHRAYNDARGVTAEFNFNLLERINRELGGRFDRGRFIHYGSYNVTHGRMESWLVSTEAQEVAIEALGRTFRFEPWEGIHLENSYKYHVSQVEWLATASGFEVQRHFFDARGWFADSLWRAA
jgi:dimethylhistidine N-methyltransferase